MRMIKGKMKKVKEWICRNNMGYTKKKKKRDGMGTKKIAKNNVKLFIDVMEKPTG